MKNGKIGIVAIDFEGTCVTNEFPGIGSPIGAIPVLKLMQSKGIKIILNTVRSDLYALEAAGWLQKQGINLWGVNRNPTQYGWSKSPKVHADSFIDDRSIGTPLIKDEYVDWEGVLELCLQHGYLGECNWDEIESTLEELRAEVGDVED